MPGFGSSRGLGGLLEDEPYKLALQEGARLGEREPFFARLSFERRKAGVAEELIVQEMRDQWEQIEQTDSDYFHWSYVEYKIERDRGIQPDKQVSSSHRQWAVEAAQASLGEKAGEQMNESSGNAYMKVGRITIARRSK